jgi:hypothetical protein
MINRFKNKGNAVPMIATNSAKPGDFDLGSLESRAAARAMLERRPPGGPEGPTKIRVIWPGEPDCAPAQYDPNEVVFRVVYRSDRERKESQT